MLRIEKGKMNMLQMQQTWEASEALIGVEGKHKKSLISISSLHSCDGLNNTNSKAHNEVVNPCIVALNIKSLIRYSNRYIRILSEKKEREHKEYVI